MGVSTNANLFFGYVWDDEHELFPDTEGKWVETLLKKRGVVNPWDSYPQEMESQISTYDQRKKFGDDWVSAHRAEIDEWHEKKKQVEAEFNIECGCHGSGEWSVPYICIKSSEITARRGYPHDVISLDIQPDWGEQLDSFLALFGIEKPHESPGWKLVSYWG